MRKREWTSLVVAVMLAACAGDTADDTDMAGDTGAVAPGTTPAPGTTTPSTGAPGTAPTGSGAALPEGVTPEMVAQGKTVFETTVCYTCHGMDGSGTALAPNLRDTVWINTDGTLQGIEGVVRNGVAQPKQFPAPMVPMGGAQLTDAQVRAVSAYVYSISHGG